MRRPVLIPVVVYASRASVSLSSFDVKSQIIRTINDFVSLKYFNSEVESTVIHADIVWIQFMPEHNANADALIFVCADYSTRANPETSTITDEDSAELTLMLLDAFRHVPVVEEFIIHARCIHTIQGFARMEIPANSQN